MRLLRGSIGVIFLLGAARALAAVEPPAAGGLATAAAADAVNLGAGSLKHRQLALGPLWLGYGLWDRVTVGSATLPWLTGLVAAGSVVPNGFVKVRLLSAWKVTAALRSAFFYAKLDDMDGDGLDVRAWIWPSQLVLEGAWSPRWATTFELSGVLARITAEQLSRQDTQVFGVALANNVHLALIQRLRLTRSITLWARLRLLLDHTPLGADARVALANGVQVDIRSRANARQGSGVAGMVGLVWSWGRLTARLAAGYGTWVLPWVGLPVGDDMVCGDLDLYWTF